MSLIKCFPPIISRRLPVGRNATNHRFYIEVDLPKIVMAGASIAGVLCQERYEWAYKWQHVFGDVDRVEMELMGHAIETCVAALHFGASYAGYEAQEAWALTAPGLYEQFAGWDLDQAAAALRERRPAALQWVLDHNEFVRWAVDLQKRHAKDSA